MALTQLLSAISRARSVPSKGWKVLTTKQYKRMYKGERLGERQHTSRPLPPTRSSPLTHPYMHPPPPLHHPKTGKGAMKTGTHTPRGGFQVVPQMLPRYLVPDLSGFTLKPYVQNYPEQQAMRRPRGGGGVALQGAAAAAAAGKAAVGAGGGAAAAASSEGKK